MKRTIVALLGIPVMLLGLAGWILPVIPGFPLFLLGLAMMIGWHPKGRQLVEGLRERGRQLLIRAGVMGKSREVITEDLFVEPKADRSNKQ